MPTTTRAETYNLNVAQIISARKLSSEIMSSAKRLNTIQRNIFAPLSNQKMSIASSTNYTNEENFVRPKILNLNNDIEENGIPAL